MTDATLSAIAIVPDQLESPARRALRRLFKRKGAVAGLVVIATFALLALLAPLVVPYDPIKTSWSLVRKPPSALHWVPGAPRSSTWESATSSLMR